MTCFEQEIAPKGKAYVGLRGEPIEGLNEICARLWDRGAKQIFLAAKEQKKPLAEGLLDGVRLTYAHDMLGLSRSLDAHRPRPEGRLTLEPLTREKKDLFLRIYNESFFSVANSSTYGEAEFEQIMGPEYRCGFGLLDGTPVGIYELGFKKENPEIGSIGLDAPYLGKGLGREFLLTLMDYLAELGCDACWLQVATANEKAHRLYQSLGFTQSEQLSRWYEVTRLNG